MAIVELFGKKLLGPDGESDTTAVLKGKSQVMVFFCARWSPISKQYTRSLSDAYEKAVKECDKTAIIFVSSDRDQKVFDEYRASMPFHALPFSARDLKETLSTKFGVKDIPALVLLDGDGNLKDGDIFGNHDEFLFDGRLDEAGSAEPEGSPAGLDFMTVDTAAEVKSTPSIRLSPEAAARFVELFGERLLTKQGEQDTSKVLAGKVNVLMVFGAHWSKSCRDRFPRLSEAYRKGLEAGSKKVVIYVSLDRDQKAFDEFWGPLPFLAVPFAARDVHKQLLDRFSVKNPPVFAAFDSEGNEVKGIFKNKPPPETLSCADAAETCTTCCIA